jgi:hypothetical protein
LRLGVTGTHHVDHPQLEAWLDAWVSKHGVPDLVVLGCARGVDKQARDWAIKHGHTYVVEVADWERLGKAAGNERNGRMIAAVANGDGAFLAFPCPRSRGTWDCLRQARAARLRCFVNRALLGHGRMTEPASE